MRAQVGGQDVVVWRGASGALSAWNNRCPHRGMALSHGFVRGDQLACLYHGWHFEQSGHCALIPAHPDLEPPQTIKTIRYWVTEAHGVIWVDTDGAAAVPPIDAALHPLRMVHVAAGADAFLDACADTPLDGAPPRRQGDVLTLGTARAAVLTTALDHDLTLAIVLTDAPDKRAMSRWVETARRRAEAGRIAA